MSNEETTPKRTHPGSIPCPTCGVEKNFSCRTRAYNEVMAHYHDAREQAATETATPQRDRDGRYSDKLSRICRCGHEKALHTAERATVDGVTYQPCIAGELSGEPCDCQTYTRKRRAR